MVYTLITHTQTGVMQNMIKILFIHNHTAIIIAKYWNFNIFICQTDIAVALAKTFSPALAAGPTKRCNALVESGAGKETNCDTPAPASCFTLFALCDPAARAGLNLVLIALCLSHEVHRLGVASRVPQNCKILWVG